MDDMGVSSGNLKEERIGVMLKNNKGDIMKCIDYQNSANINVLFIDKFMTVVNTNWCNFTKGTVQNPYRPTVFGVGIAGNKYPCRVGGVLTKEYRSWQNMLARCYTEMDEAYNDASCCDEWLLYDIFYEWLHKQENFNKWLNGYRWCLDKDILIKGNKVYSPETCCLVSFDVNILFAKRKRKRGDLPIGVCFENHTQRYLAHCNTGEKNGVNLGRYDSPIDAFCAYKTYKEQQIKQIATEEYNKGNIIKQCYEAMMSYSVDIDD